MEHPLVGCFSWRSVTLGFVLLHLRSPLTLETPIGKQSQVASSQEKLGAQSGGGTEGNRRSLADTAFKILQHWTLPTSPDPFVLQFDPMQDIGLYR